MIRLWAVLCVVIAAAGVAGAAGNDAGAKPAGAKQADVSTDGLGGYSSLRLDEVGVFVGGFDGTIDRLSDGVRITLISDDPNLKPLPISAREMKFTWAQEAGGKPTRILLEGKVAIDHPQATCRAEKADWDLTAGILTFTGAPVITTAQVPQGIEGQKVVLNFNTNKFEVYGGRAKEIVLGESMAAGRAPEPDLLREQDIADWSGFVNQIKAEAAAEPPSPGKQILGLLEEKVRKMLTSTPTDALLADKPALLKQINKAVASPRLYSEAAFAGVDLPAEVKALLAAGQDTPASKLNRALLHAAYPKFVSAPKAAS